MRRREFLNLDIEYLNLNKTTLCILKENQIFTIKDVWYLKRKDLQLMNIQESEIKKIIITLELQGMDLNSKIYEK